MIEVTPKIIKIDFLGKIDRSNHIPISAGVRFDYAVNVYYENGIVANFNLLDAENIVSIYNYAKLPLPELFPRYNNNIFVEKLQNFLLPHIKIVQTKESKEYIRKYYPINYDIKNIIRPYTHNVYECHCRDIGLRNYSLPGPGEKCISWERYKEMFADQQYHNLNNLLTEKESMNKTFYTEFLRANEIQFTNNGEDGVLFDINLFYTNGKLQQLIGLSEKEAKTIYAKKHKFPHAIFNYNNKNDDNKRPQQIDTSQLINIGNIKKVDNNLFTVTLVYANKCMITDKFLTKVELQKLFNDNNLLIPDYLKKYLHPLF